MKDKIHPKQFLASFKCAACGSSFETYTTKNAKEVVVDVCSKCHPFYVGGTANQRIAGRAEKFSKKVDAAPSVVAEKKVRVKKQKTKKTLEDLA